jgi:hypothetical protein
VIAGAVNVVVTVVYVAINSFLSYFCTCFFLSSERFRSGLWVSARKCKNSYRC